MSSPHVAGLAALFKELKPSWSPMAIKSALMTTGYDVLDGGTPAPNTNPVLIFRQGAGHVQPNRAANPGLVFDSGFNDWLAFICATQPAGLDATCNALWAAGYSKSASDLNGASISVGALAGSATVKRSVTNVSGNPATFTASHTGLAGLNVQVTPASLTLGAGQTGAFTVKFTTVTATPGVTLGGQLRWTDGTHTVRVPMVVVPVALAAPVEASGSYDITFGYTGAFSATARGLIPAAVTPGTVTQDPDQTFDPADSSGTVFYDVTVPAGTTYARFALFDADVAAGSDIDVFVYRGSTLVGVSTNGGSNEQVNLLNPVAGTYRVYLHGWGLPSGTSQFKLHAWVLGTASAGNMAVTAPASANVATTGTIGLTFSGLTAGTKYLGSVFYSGTPGLPAPTIITVNP